MTGGDTSSYAASTTGLGALTSVHLAMIAIFAVLAILAIIWGTRLRARRKAAEREVAARNATFAQETPSPTQAPVAGEGVETRLPEEVGRVTPLTQPTPAAPRTVTEPPAPEPATQPETIAEQPVRPATPVSSPEPEPVTEPPALADEPIAAAAPMDASPATLAADLDTAPEPPATPDRTYQLTDLKGLGPKVAAQLNALGFVTVADLARLSDQEATALDTQLGSFTGRMKRDRWREQAQFLAAGDRAGFEAAFGKL